MGFRFNFQRHGSTQVSESGIREKADWNKDGELGLTEYENIIGRKLCMEILNLAYQLINITSKVHFKACICKNGKLVKEQDLDLL